MPPYSSDDHYLDPASGVLKNRLGITDAATLEGGFDLAHLQAIHRHLFSDLYEWAGQLRTIGIGKGGHLFAHHRSATVRRITSAN